MKKIVVFAALAALVLGACSKTETFYTPTEADAVSFGAYSGRTITKAGQTDDMNLDALKTIGFGVFATYSATDDFDTAGATNDFMNNQLVNYDDSKSKWTYSPIKYWPNPTNGQSADAQKLSFFAYAPFCEPGTSETTGITGFEIDGTTKHNLVHYAFTNDGKPNVDLLWGYKDGWDKVSTADAERVNINLTRQATTIKFKFRHLLAKLGGSQEGTITDPNDPAYVANGLTIEANPTADPTAEWGNIATGDFGGNKGTKITVSKITVESAPADGVLKDANGIIVSYPDPADPNSVQKGTLDLYTGVFTLDGGATPQAVQFKQELSANPTAAEIAAGVNELADFLKEVPGETDFSKINKGVTKKAVNVYKDENNPIILVPGTAPVVNVTITYVVRTYDEKLPKGFSEVPQTVFGQVKFPTIEANKKYNLRIKLGLNDVKFEASVEDWSEGETWNDANGNGVAEPGEITTGATEIELPEQA